jgi:predicted amidohydrolase YtcJ
MCAGWMRWFASLHGGRLLNREDLGHALPDNPVRVDHVSMHGAALNSLALR